MRGWSGALTAAILAIIILVVMAIIGPQWFLKAFKPAEQVLSGENLSQQVETLRGRAYLQPDICAGTCYVGYSECPVGVQVFGSFTDCPNGVCCRQ
ncbi:hypothetical protein KY329_05165 [Candidatus Woesearchaeota archaeon]|nr:hypothetical protein [Candidatus Woesearchaeota archaeon]